jgi:UDP-N-acetylmuramate--alanine ligase
VAFLPIYAASEDPIPGISSRALAEAIANHRQGLGDSTVACVEDGEQAIRFMAAHAQPGDTCLVLGAGDVGALAPPLTDFFVSPGHEPHVPEPTPLVVGGL